MAVRMIVSDDPPPTVDVVWEASVTYGYEYEPLERRTLHRTKQGAIVHAGFLRDQVETVLQIHPHWGIQDLRVQWIEVGR